MNRVMIVDDDAIIRKGLSKNIPWSEVGFEVVGTAADGEEACRLFQETQPDVVISDIKMPFLDGLGLARKILARTNDVKIILLTGYDEFDYAKQALELRVFEYVLKPVDHEYLLECVKRAARELQQEREVRRRVKESLPLLRQHFLSRLIHDQYRTAEEIREEVEFLELPLHAAHYIAVVVKIDDFTGNPALKNVAGQEVLKLNLSDLCNRFLAGRSGDHHRRLLRVLLRVLGGDVGRLGVEGDRQPAALDLAGGQHVLAGGGGGHARSTAPVALATAATMRSATASICTSVSVASRG